MLGLRRGGAFGLVVALQLLDQRLYIRGTGIPEGSTGHRSRYLLRVSQIDAERPHLRLDLLQQRIGRLSRLTCTFQVFHVLEAF